MGRTEDEEAIDQIVGQNVRTRRVLLGMSQYDVSRELGITFQQLQKYEHGTNRVSASRLVSLGRILHCPAAAFFEGIDEADSTAYPANRTTANALIVALGSLTKAQRSAIEKLVMTLSSSASKPQDLDIAG